MFKLSAVDFFIVVFYFVFVLAVGFYLRRRTSTGKDFFLAGRSQSAWVAGISFIAASMGALELMGWSAATYQYGMMAVHWYWIGVVPAMLLLGVFMMPFYYISKTHSVPGYLKLRFGESSRVLAAVTFVVMTLLTSGISMYCMGLVLENFFGWEAALLPVLLRTTLMGILVAWPHQHTTEGPRRDLALPPPRRPR